MVSEKDWDEVPTSARFLERDRIVTGLSGVMIAVEAADPSGTVEMVREIEALGRPALAVEGMPGSPTSAGIELLAEEYAEPVGASRIGGCAGRGLFQVAPWQGSARLGRPRDPIA